MEIPQHLSLSLTKEQKMRLAPFIATWLTFSVLYVPFLGYPPATLGSAVFKVLPILSLCVYVFTETKELNRLFSVDAWLTLNVRDQNVIIGLLCSGVGDICLVWRELLFVPGLLSFACGHVFYMKAMHADGTKSRTKSLFTLLAVDIFLFIQSGISSYILTLLVALYISLIFTVGWYATARYEDEGSKAALSGCIGALLFIFSDLLIAVDKWLFTIPMSSLLIMASYYAAQCGIALSVTQDLK